MRVLRAINLLLAIHVISCTVLYFSCEENITRYCLIMSAHTSVPSPVDDPLFVYM